MSNTAALSNVVIPMRPSTEMTTRRVRPVVDKTEVEKRQYLDEAEVEKLIKAAPSPRDRAMLLLAFTHALRVSELINLRWAQISFDTARLQVERLKGSESGVHPLRGREVRALKALQRSQPAGFRFVFVSKLGAPLTRQAVDKRVRAAGVKAGLGGGIHMHLCCWSTIADTAWVTWVWTRFRSRPTSATSKSPTRKDIAGSTANASPLCGPIESNPHLTRVGAGGG